jgi:uncharacterized protein YjbI with pentapeptide repeats
MAERAMADEQHLALLRRSVREWNRWRAENPRVTPDLAGAGLRGLDLSGANLAGALLKGADLRGTILSGSSLAGSALAGANLFKAVLDSAGRDSADLRGFASSTAPSGDGEPGSELTEMRIWNVEPPSRSAECAALVTAP